MIETVHLHPPDKRNHLLTAKNEKRLKSFLLNHYQPDTEVTIWETGEKLKINDIFET